MLQQLLDRSSNLVGDYLPNIVGALIILVVGWIVALVAAAVVGDIAVAIAFGLGSRETAGRQVEEWVRAFRSGR